MNLLPVLAIVLVVTCIIVGVVVLCRMAAMEDARMDERIAAIRRGK